MTEEQKKLGRRNFIKAVAAIPPAGALVWKASSMTPIRAGIIGTGSQGRVLMENAPPSHIRVSGVCDIYPKNLEKGLKIARERFDPQAESYTDYRKLLERKDLEAVLIATPMWQHEPMAIEALQAGKHTFSEKAMAHSIEGCRRMIDAAHSARRTLQIGHHRNYNSLYQEAYQLIKGGVIGDVYHVRALWHRNKSWRRKLPKDFDPTPWGYANLDEYKNWRLYRKFGHGLMGELGSHQIQVVNWFSGSLPHSVYGSGGIHHYKDGREAEDHVYLIYEYPDGLTFTYSSIQTNSHDHYYEQFMGTKGTILLSGEREAMLFSEGGEAAATELAAAPMGEGPVMEASESRANDASGSTVGGTSSGMATALRGYQNELAGFGRIIRHGAENMSDGPMAMNVVIPMIKGNESIAKGEKLEIPKELYWM